MIGTRTRLSVLAIAWVTGCGSAAGDGMSLDNADSSSSDPDALTSGFGVDAAMDTRSAPKTCTKDSDCNDGNACTLDVCELGTGEIKEGQCGHAPTACAEKRDSGAEPPSELPPPVDTSCKLGCESSEKTFPAAVPLVSTAPAGCTAGFELNNPSGKTVYTIPRASGTAAVPIEIQFATYLVPDHIKLIGVTSGGEYTVFDTCTVQTAAYSDPTGGCVRPPDDSLRQYAVTLKAGTTALKVDLSGVCSPIYLRVRGLCAFKVTPFYSGCGFRTLP